MTEFETVKEKITELLEARRYADLTALAAEIPAIDLAEIFGDVPSEYQMRLFRLLPKDTASELFIHIDTQMQERIIGAFSDREVSEMLAELYLDDTVDVIEEMPAHIVKKILRNSSTESRSRINELLGYPRDSAGTIMTTEYVRLLEHMTVEAALLHLRHVAIDKETIYTCYVTDSKRRLIGIVTAKDLLISEPETEISEIMERSVIYAYTGDGREEVARKIEKYGFLALPIVDNEERLVGIVTVDDAIEVLGEEIEEDISKMAAITPSETPYLKSSSYSIFKSRIPWLLLLMISATLSSTILSAFESRLAAVLILFVPMLMDTGGNSGNQASVTLVRGLSLGEIKKSDFLLVWWQEIRVGMLCAITLGAVAFGKIMLVDRLVMNNGEVTLTVGVVVAVTLALTVIIAKLVGSALPIFASAIGLDPAVMASPFITTAVDAISLVVYFLIAAPFFSLG